MPTFNIPKQARNKYNFIKGSDNSNFITQSQLMMSSGGFGGGGNSGTTYSQVQQQINDTLAERGYVSYTYLKTINGYSLIGEGDIEVSGGGTVDLSPYALKTYVADYVAAYAPEPDLSSYATKTYVSEYVAAYAPEPDLSSYVTKTELNAAGYASVYECTYNQYNSLATKDNNTIYIITDEDPISLIGYATVSYVNEKCAEVEAASYAYTNSKIVGAMTYNDVNNLVREIISYMKSTGELIDSATVDQKIADSRTP